MTPDDRLKAINPAYDKLLTKLIATEEQYNALCRNVTSSRQQARLSRLAKEIDRLQMSVRICEKLQDEALAGKDWE